MGAWRALVLLAVVAGCGGGSADDAGAPPRDAGRDAATILDAASDAGPPRDAGTSDDDAGPRDAGSPDDAPSADAATPRDAAASDVISVLTINIHNAYLEADTWPMRRDRIAAAILAWQPDVVALQEVVETGGDPNGAEQIATRAPGYEHRYFRTHEAFVFDEGIGVLSHWPITSIDTRELPHVDLGGIAHRSVLLATVSHPDGPLRLFATHLTVDPDTDVRADQAAEIIRFVAEHPGDLPGFLAGDMNAVPDETAMRVLRGDVMHDGEQGDFLDAWTTARPADPGLTHPSDGPDRRIDYVYSLPSRTGAHFTVRDCEIVFAPPETVSDHLGVLCTFERALP